MEWWWFFDSIAEWRGREWVWPIKSSFRFSIRRREKKGELVVLSAVSLREAKCATLYAKVAIHDFVRVEL